MPFVLLTGFLGAGKTTVLKHLLNGDHGKRLGVIVNDLASVNVDANVLEGALEKAGARSVSLENGCVCCSASDDLRESVNELLSTGGAQLDAIVVELSGVAEPDRARAVLDNDGLGQPSLGRELSVRTVAVVDSPSFAADYMTDQLQHGAPYPGDGNERVSKLLAEQLEFADLVLLNKADIATEEELQQARALTHALNEGAEVQITEHGRVEPSMLWTPSISARRKDAEPVKDQSYVHDHGHEQARSHSHGHGHGHDGTCSDPSHDHRSLAEKRFGIVSFVYTTTTPLIRQRLMQVLKCWSQGRESLGNKLHLENLPAHAGSESSDVSSTPLLPILRSKGIVCVDTNPTIPYNWSHAGRALSLSMWMPAGSQWDGKIPCTELVFIGAGHDEAAIRALLDSCLLTQDACAA